jgi:hypothetical protein
LVVKLIQMVADQGATELYDGTSWTTSPGSLSASARRLYSRVQEHKLQLLAFNGSITGTANSNSLQKNLMELLGQQVEI